MKLFTGWILSAGLVLTAAAANAQVPAPYGIRAPSYLGVSDVEGPYSALPGDTPASGYGPMLLPPREVYTVVRDSGFSPLGIPQRRGLVYTISVLDRGGHDGRLVIDARTGRIIRFMPAYRTATYGPVGPLPPISRVAGPPRPPRAIPGIVTRTPPVPAPRPTSPTGDESRQLAARPVAEPAQQAAGVPQAKPADAQTTRQAAAPATVEPKPVAPAIRPTQEMPKMQGLD